MKRQPEGSTTVRRFGGRLSDELHFVSRPAVGAGDIAAQAQSAYEALAAALEAEAVGPGALVAETVWFRRIEADLNPLVAKRAEVFAALGAAGSRPATSFVEQAPLNDGALIEIGATAIVPRASTGSAADDLLLEPSCSCERCSKGLGAKTVLVGDELTLYAGSLHGRGEDAFSEARDMFGIAEELLHAADMSFSDVVRTWIYVRDIDRDYDALNRARRDFFHQSGIELRPASTGVQGGPGSSQHDFSMSLYAIRSPQAPEVSILSTPLLNEAWSYGADFSRGLRVVDSNRTALYVSGTASIDEAGRTVHVGDFDAQAERMLDNIESLLVHNGAGFDDLATAVAYSARPQDAEKLRSMFRRRGFEGFPCAMVEAPLCRPDLLCETEVLAVLPLSPTRA